MNVNLFDILTFAAATAACLYAMRAARATTPAAAAGAGTTATEHVLRLSELVRTGITEVHALRADLEQSEEARRRLEAMLAGHAEELAGHRTDIAQRGDAILSALTLLRQTGPASGAHIENQVEGVSIAVNAITERLTAHEKALVEHIENVLAELRGLRAETGATKLTTQGVRGRVDRLTENLERVLGLETSIRELQQTLAKPQRGATTRKRSGNGRRKPSEASESRPEQGRTSQTNTGQDADKPPQTKQTPAGSTTLPPAPLAPAETDPRPDGETPAAAAGASSVPQGRD